MVLLAIGRNDNRLSNEQIHYHEEVLSKIIVAQDEEEEVGGCGHGWEVSDVHNEFKAEEELPEYEDIDKAKWNKVVEQESNV